MTNRVVLRLCIPLALVALQGCGSGSHNAPVSQVAARVNGGEITLYRVNSALGASNDLDPQKLAQARRGVLDSLINQELAAQAAEESKLDRTPAVMQAIESARREVLARAWLERVSTALPKPDAAQVSRYYDEHPALFAQRRIYNMQQIVLKAEPELMDEVRQKIDAKASMQQISQWLEAKQVKFSAVGGLRAAEQIPLDILATLGKAGDGQTLLIEQPDSALILHVVSSTQQPVDEAAVSDKIRQFLVKQSWSEAIASEMKRLKQGASIAYMGEFSLPAAATATHASAADETQKASLALDASSKTTDKKVAQP